MTIGAMATTATRYACHVLACIVSFLGQSAMSRTNSPERPRTALRDQNIARCRLADERVGIFPQKKALGDCLGGCSLHHLDVPIVRVITLFERQTRIALCLPLGFC